MGMIDLYKREGGFYNAEIVSSIVIVKGVRERPCPHHLIVRLALAIS
jgi:hypothetical protein